VKLQTQIPIQKVGSPIDYKSNVLLFGSCFAEHISKKFEYYKFQNTSNPFGILFHPKAIEKLLLKALHKQVYTSDDVFYYNERWQCYDAHSKLSHVSKEALLEALNSNVSLTYQSVIKASHIIITLGTAWVYVLKDTQATVANCHKVPQNMFEKRLLSSHEISASLKSVIREVKAVNPNVQFTFTVSPVRHIKDGFVENTLSKSHLIAAVHQVITDERSISNSPMYFPSFEIMMDELRDYRFYSEDLVHPNSTAVNYIWELFQNAWIAPNVYPLMKEVDAVQKGLTHKPFNPSSQAHLKFIEGINNKISKLKTLGVPF
jgi:hypothetical protein